ncbi:glycosyltransferase [Vibrio cholerae]|uniref:glycosyltransferase n=1 Tax=Vibrio cholerae TaxID=666 RepID=UPI002058D92C|nr:glycosyltransferase [Vibrio cholerae]MCU4202725.1 glycosyltransferase [Vibrio cholerae]MCU4204656.1 glycosyltransferase [Vibrio cholerae]BCN18460.1 putative glycosyltransferase [Vibrio cholerae]GHX80317.1 hypothetical protein VCSRO160_1811 [Vibrio cholerae]
MKSFKLGLFIPNHKDWMGGVNYYLRLCEMIASSKCDIEVVTFFDSHSSKEIMEMYSNIEAVTVVNLSVTSLKQSTYRQLLSLTIGRDPFLAKLVRDYQLDYIFQNAMFPGWRFNAKVISWIPDLQHFFLPDLFSFNNRVIRTLGFFVQYAFSHMVVFSSEDARDSFFKIYSFFSRDKSRLLRFSVSNIDFSDLEMLDIKGKFGLADKFIFVSNQFWPHKNHKLILDAIRINKISGRRSMQIVSTGVGSKEFHSLKDSFSITDCEFKLLGYVSNDDVSKLLNASVALLNPSLFEGWSTPVEEAKSINKYMLLSNINIHKEQAPYNATFFSTDSPNELADLILDDCNYKSNVLYNPKKLMQQFFSDFHNIFS